MPLTLPSPCCLLVPLFRPHVTEDEALSLVITHARAANSTALTILHPPEISSFVARLRAWFERRSVQEITFASLEVPSHHFASLSSYSELMLSESFYQSLTAYEWLFVVQPDALLLSDYLAPWLDMPYSYIGAPWFVGLDHPVKPLLPLGGGNGGFSLRRISDCIATLRFRGSIYRYLRRMELATLPHQRWRAEWRALRYASCRGSNLQKINLFEDLFWSFVAPLINPSFVVAPFHVSSRFAIETEPRFLQQQMQQLPLGCHAYRRYDPTFWEETWSLHPELIDRFKVPARQLMADLE